jgi:hypothetical protein
METRWMVGIMLVILLVFSGCSIQPVAESSTVAATELGPAEVTQQFYDWYLQEASQPPVEGKGNILTEGGYAASPFLAPEFVEEVKRTVASFERGGFDPLLLAQDLPTAMQVVEERIDGGSAHVRMTTTFFGHELDVVLRHGDDGWQIVGVGKVEPDLRDSGPEGLVDWFYSTYLAYPGNALVTRSFLSRAYMTEAFVEKVNGILDSFDRSSPGGGYDPILLAQDIPDNFKITGGSEEGDVAVVAVQTSFEGHALQVTLHQEGGRWKIAEIESAR